MQVVHRGQHGAQHFTAPIQVVEVGATEPATHRTVGPHMPATGVAGTGLVQRRVVCFVSGIADFQVVPGRLERIDSGRGFSIFIDYAHTDDALMNVLTSLRQICRGRIIVVFGCGGDRDKGKRPKMGKVATELADLAIVTSDNPRNEDPQAITNDIMRGITGTNYAVVIDRKEAIRKALAMAAAGDIILLAGKGHETYQVSRNSTIHFDEREVVCEWLQSVN